MTTRDEIRAEKALQGVDLPASKQQLIDYAESHGADAKSLQALRALPDQQFGSLDEVTAAVPQQPEGEDRPGGTAR